MNLGWKNDWMKNVNKEKIHSWLLHFTVCKDFRVCFDFKTYQKSDEENSVELERYKSICVAIVFWRIIRVSLSYDFFDFYESLI